MKLNLFNENYEASVLCPALCQGWELGENTPQDAQLVGTFFKKRLLHFHQQFILKGNTCRLMTMPCRKLIKNTAARVPGWICPPLLDSPRPPPSLDLSFLTCKNMDI